MKKPYSVHAVCVVLKDLCPNFAMQHKCAQSDPQSLACLQHHPHPRLLAVRVSSIHLSQTASASGSAGLSPGTACAQRYGEDKGSPWSMASFFRERKFTLHSTGKKYLCWCRKVGCNHLSFNNSLGN